MTISESQRWRMYFITLLHEMQMTFQVSNVGDLLSVRGLAATQVERG